MREVLTPTWAQQVLDEHRELRQKVTGLRRYLEAPRPRPEQMGAHTWSAELSRRLVGLHDELYRHFRFEDEGGMVEEISTRHPRASGSIERLVDEHPKILARLRGLTHEALIYSQGTGEPQPAPLRRLIFELLDHLERHEREETEIIQRLACDDIGPGD